MNFKFSILVLVIFILTGCFPKFTGVDIPPTPVAWQSKSEKNTLVVDKNFDSSGNAYILVTYFDTATSNVAFELTKLDPGGTTLWRIKELIDTPSLEYTSEVLGIDSKLLFDSANNIYIVGTILGFFDDSGAGVNYAVYSAKIQSDGIASWQNLYSNAQTFGITTSGVISSTDNLYVAFSNLRGGYVLSFDAQGVATEIYIVNPQSKIEVMPNRWQLKKGADDTVYLYNGFYSREYKPDGSSVASDRQFIQLSATGQILQTMAYNGYVDDFIVYPDGTIYVIHDKNIKKYALTGTLVWESNIQTQSVLEGHYYAFEDAVLSSDATLNIFYSYICQLDKGNTCLSSEIIPRGSTSIKGYNIVQLDALGQEVARIERYLPMSINLQTQFSWIYGAYAYVSGFGNARFQIDKFDNLYVIEKFVNIRLGLLFDYNYFGSINTESLIRQYDQSGKLTNQARAPSYPTGFIDLAENTDIFIGPLFVNSNGSVSIFDTVHAQGSVILSNLKSTF